MSITWLSSVSSFWVFWASSVGWHPVWPPRWLTACSRSLTPWSSRTGALGRWDSGGHSSGTCCSPCVTWPSSSYTVQLCSQHPTVLLCLKLEMNILINRLDLWFKIHNIQDRETVNRWYIYMYLSSSSSLTYPSISFVTSLSLASSEINQFPQ